MDDFSQLRAAAQATLPPSTLPLLPREFVLQLHQQIIDRENSLDRRGEVRSRRVLVGPGKHCCLKEGIDELQPVDLSTTGGGMQCNEVARGKMLICRVITACVRTAGVQMVVEDPSGRVAPVIIHHVPLSWRPAELNEVYSLGSYFAILEPSVRETRDGYLIRIESPSDFLRLSPYSPLVSRLQWSTSPNSSVTLLSPSQLKDRGNIIFGQGRYREAFDAYSIGIDKLKEGGDVAISGQLGAILRCNRAQAALKVSLYGTALKDCLAGISNPWLDSEGAATLGRKLHYRAALAEYGLLRFEEASRRLDTLFSRYGEEEQAMDLYRRTQVRLVESSRGEYDWKFLFRESTLKTTLDVAPYSSSLVQPVDIPGRGRGLIAVEDIQEGQLLIVAKPLAIGFGDDQRKSFIVPANLYTETIDPYSHYDLVSLLIAKMEDEPELRKQVADLYPGPSFSTTDEKAVEEATKDVSRLESIATYNAFHTESLTQKSTVLSLADSATADIHAPSSLYHLPSFLNHSCVGNVTYSFLSDIIFVRARRSIKKGEELLDSYIDSLEGLSRRTEKFQKHGFICQCELCGFDRRDGKERCAEREKIAVELDEMTDRIHGSQTTSASGHLQEITSFVERIDRTYDSSRPSLKPALYSALRLLAQTLAGDGERRQAIATELRALEALGGVFEGAEMKEVPKVGDVNAVRSSLFVAIQHKALGEKEAAEKWVANAKRIESGQAGADLFELRYREWICVPSLPQA